MKREKEEKIMNRATREARKLVVADAGVQNKGEEGDPWVNTRIRFFCAASLGK